MLDTTVVLSVAVGVYAPLAVGWCITLGVRWNQARQLRKVRRPSGRIKR